MLVWYATYKTGFKSGGFSNSAIYSTLTVDQIADITFEPESVKGFEGGVKASLLDGAMNIEFEAYRYKFNDLQIDFLNSPAFAFITENAGGARTTGAEIQAVWQPQVVTGLRLNASLPYNDSKYTDFIAPCYAGQTPARGCTIFIPGQVPKQELGGFNNPIDTQKGFATLDAALRFGTEDGTWQFSIIGKNLTNKYALLASGDTPSTGGGTGTAGGFSADRTGTPIMPRTIEFQLTWRY